MKQSRKEQEGGKEGGKGKNDAFSANSLQHDQKLNWQT
jgi:hypothetical protein